MVFKFLFESFSPDFSLSQMVISITILVFFGNNFNQFVKVLSVTQTMILLVPFDGFCV